MFDLTKEMKEKIALSVKAYMDKNGVDEAANLLVAGGVNRQSANDFVLELRDKTKK